MSALSDRSLVQSNASRALDVWRQLLLEPLDTTKVTVPDASWLVTFHGGTVHILQEPPEDYNWKGNFGCAIWPSAVDETDMVIGASETPLGITTAFYYKERQRTREPGEAGIEDLPWYLRAAALSTDQLVWKDTWVGTPPVTVPPTYDIVQGGDGMALKRGRIFPASFSRFIDRERKCSVRTVLLDVAWIQQIFTC